MLVRFDQLRHLIMVNHFVENLVVQGPCNLNLVPDMKSLKVVEVKLDSVLDSCTFWGRS